MSSLSPSIRDSFRRKMSDQIKRTESKIVEEEKKVEKKKKEFFEALGTPDCGDNQKMFSELFFDPADINLHDFPVDTYHHMHAEWPEWVVNSVPAKDDNYQWNKQVVYAFVAADDEHRFLVGLPGSGKTSLPMQVASVTGRPVFKQAFQNDLEADEWIMSKEIDDSGTHWNVLPFIKSMEFPFYAVLDEFNRLRRGGRLLMNQLLNDGGSMQLRDGREVTPHPKWRAIATDNTRGMGDGLDKFDGDIADISTTDRFGMMLEVEYLPVDQQVELVRAWFPDMDAEIAKYIVTFGEKIITGYKSGVFPLPWTPRRMNKAAKMAMRYRNPVLGIKAAYYNFLAEDDERKACNQCLKDTGLAKLFGEFA